MLIVPASWLAAVPSVVETSSGATGRGGPEIEHLNARGHESPEAEIGVGTDGAFDLCERGPICVLGEFRDRLG